MDTLSKLRQRRLANARKPAGRLGRLLVRAMNTSHYRMTRWGLSHISIGKQDTILDIGCGGGGAVHRLAGIATNGKVYGVDYSAESVAISRRTNKRFVDMGRVEIQQDSVSRLPFADSMFDLVTAVNTHNYWPDLCTDMQEILRVLKPKGSLVMIGSVYEGGKHDKRNQGYATLIQITFPSVDDLREIFERSGYAEVEMFENHDGGWFCGTGVRPLQSY